MKVVVAAAALALLVMNPAGASAEVLIGKPYAKPPTRCMRMFGYFQRFHGPAAFATPNGVPVKEAKTCGQSEQPNRDVVQDALTWCNNASHSYSCKVIATHH